MKHPIQPLLASLAAAAALAACQSSSYTSSLSLSGTEHQRDLSATVEAAIVAHEDSRQVFSSAYEVLGRFTDPGQEVTLELYQELRRQVDRAAQVASQLHPHMARVENDGASLFTDWNKELEQFASQKMRARSEGRMQQVYKDFDRFLAQMRETQEHVDEALVSLRDYVLFFNHNLTPDAIATLDGENEGFARRVFALNESVKDVRRRGDAFAVALQGRQQVMATVEEEPASRRR